MFITVLTTARHQTMRSRRPTTSRALTHLLCVCPILVPSIKELSKTHESTYRGLILYIRYAREMHSHNEIITDDCVFILRMFIFHSASFFLYFGGFISFLVPSLPVLYRFLQFFNVFFYISYFYFPSFYIIVTQLNTHPSLYANRNLFLLCFFLSFFISFFILFPSHYIFSFIYRLIFSFFFTYFFNLRKVQAENGISAGLHDHIKNVESVVLIFLLL